jgi:L-alanine-DL-glutamate epimerase-like enolase superfamily enzyme
VGSIWAAMVRAIRNLGRPGIASMAISAVDIALWDLKARLLDVALPVALDAARDTVPAYGSGGFTSYPLDVLREQVAGWAAEGLPAVKIKVGRRPDDDSRRLVAARDAVGPHVELFVDANGVYSRKQALAWAEQFADHDVRWLEEPVSSDDLDGLRLIRDRSPAGMDVTAGEYGFDLPYFERMLAAGAVDCLQADVTRCGGITAFAKVAALCDAHGIELSAHTAPHVSAHACTVVWHLRHLEYFHTHARIEHALFDGALRPHNGRLIPDRSRPGLGIELRRADADRYAA